MDRMDETDDDVDFRPRRPAPPEARRIVDRGVSGEGDREWRLYELEECIRGIWGGFESVPIFADGVCNVGFIVRGDDVVLPAKPFATTPLGRPAVDGIAELLVGYLLVCGRGLPSLDLPSFELEGLSSRLGVEWLPRLLEFLFRRVFSRSQCVQFFQCAIMAWEGFFFTFFCSPDDEVPFSASASLVVTKWRVDPRDRALRRTPSLGGGSGFRCCDELADRMESLSIGGGGASPSGLKFPLAALAKSASPGRSAMTKLGK